MFKMRFMDGTDVPAEYERKVSALVAAAAAAQEVIDPDELEEHKDKILRRMSPHLSSTGGPMMQFSVFYRQMERPVLIVVDTSRYDPFYGFSRVVKEL